MNKIILTSIFAVIMLIGCSSDSDGGGASDVNVALSDNGASIKIETETDDGQQEALEKIITKENDREFANVRNSTIIVKFAALETLNRVGLRINGGDGLFDIFSSGSFKIELSPYGYNYKQVATGTSTTTNGCSGGDIYNEYRNFCQYSLGDEEARYMRITTNSSGTSFFLRAIEANAFK